MQKFKLLGVFCNRVGCVVIAQNSVGFCITPRNFIVMAVTVIAVIDMSVMHMMLTMHNLSPMVNKSKILADNNS